MLYFFCRGCGVAAVVLALGCAAVAVGGAAFAFGGAGDGAPLSWSCCGFRQISAGGCSPLPPCRGCPFEFSGNSRVAGRRSPGRLFVEILPAPGGGLPLCHDKGVACWYIAGASPLVVACADKRKAPGLLLVIFSKGILSHSPARVKQGRACAYKNI